MSTTPSFFANIKNSFSSIKLTTPVAILLASVILGASHLAYGVFANETSSSEKKSSMFAGRAIDDTDFIEGTTKNNIYVVEYSDPECPYCVQFHQSIKQIRTEFKDRIAFVYRHFPLTQIHLNAFDESKAIACAGNIGGSSAFYGYADSLYGYKSSMKTTELPKTGKEDMAKNMGLDMAKFSECMKDPKTAQIVNSSINDGVSAGVQGTPTTFILKKTRKGFEIVATIDGARPYDYVKAAIEQALAD